jgi:type VI secretion system secreted protein VgrG
MPDGAISQKNRLGKYHSPIGADALALLRFRGEEGVNILGQFRVEALSPTGGVDLDAVLGLHGTVEIASLQHGSRFYDGIVTEAEVIDRRQDGWLYVLTMKPWFWLAGLRRNQRIFHDKTAPQIISEVLKDYSFENRPDLVHAYDPIEYTVQYGESDLAFVCRMMERYGISFHFEHALKSHVMVLTDAIECFKPVPGGTRQFQALLGQHRWEEEHFNRWSLGRKITTGRVQLTDYNFKTPTAVMPVDQTGGAKHAQGEIESFDYPGIYLAQAPGKAVVRMRADGERGPDGLFHAEGDAASVSPGMLVTLAGHHDDALNGKTYLLTHAEHQFDAEGYASGSTLSEGDSYKGTYRFHPQAKPFLPAIKTPLSHILGPQTAVVVGEGEIDCDEYGRILVRFHWDLKDAYSMRCRVAQIWAGNAWGGMVIPRIGMEVLVEFLEGDPDKPLVTGCVYNGKNRPFYPLPEHKTKSVFRTDSHDGKQTADGFNELTFEDEQGKENIYFHAQRDNEIHIGNNRAKRVDKTEVESIGNCKFTDIAKDLTTQIGGNVLTAIGVPDLQTEGVAPMRPFDDGLLQMAYKGTVSDTPDAQRGHYKLFVAQSLSESVGTQASLRVGDSFTTNVGTSHTLNIGSKKSEFVGDSSYETVRGSKYMHVHEEIDLRCGQSRFLMKRNGDIEITGRHIKLKADKIDEN